jgi:hypothetical protein
MENLIPALLSSLNGMNMNSGNIPQLMQPTSDNSDQTPVEKLNPNTCVANLINHVKYIIPKGVPRLVSEKDFHTYESKDKNSEKYSSHQKAFKQLKNFDAYFTSNSKNAVEDIRVFVNANADSIISDPKLTFLEKNSNIFCGSYNSSINTKSCIPISYAFKLCKTYKKLKNQTSVLSGEAVLEQDPDYSCNEQLIYHFLVASVSLSDRVSNSMSVRNHISELVKKHGFKTIPTTATSARRANDPITPFANQLLSNINPATIASVLKEASKFLCDAPKILEETKKEHGNDNFVKTIEGVLGGKDGLENFASAFSQMATKIADKIEQNPSNSNILDNVKDVITEDKKIQNLASTMFSAEKRQEHMSAVTNLLSSVMSSPQTSTSSSNSESSININNNSTASNSGSTLIDSQLESIKNLLEDVGKTLPEKKD